MAQEHGATERKFSQADFFGMLALGLMALAALSALIVAIAAMNAG